MADYHYRPSAAEILQVTLSGISWKNEYDEERMNYLLQQVIDDPSETWLLKQRIKPGDIKAQQLPEEIYNRFITCMGKAESGRVIEEPGPHYSCSLPQIDLQKACVIKDGRQVNLTAVETRVLSCLAASIGKVVGLEKLSRVINEDYSGAVWTDPKYHIRNLRNKLGDNVKPARIICSRRGLGYMLNDNMHNRIILRADYAI
ncbi:MAG: winged helix-turn-helix domain-containing protein [Syntrophomonadaceae bacterium]|nr:winged helix-turn-helix domain-containing protein [Syntrophomonadaceae bacterium]